MSFRVFTPLKACKYNKANMWDHEVYSIKMNGKLIQYLWLILQITTTS
jgi:hypothetical protein